MPFRLAAAALVLLTVLPACETAAPAFGPPEGWQAEGTRWWVPGTDTAAAFRDLSSIDAMGVRRSDTEFVGWAQDEMAELYRTNPERVDSVFGADFLGRVRDGVPADGDYATAARTLVRSISGEFYQRYNPSQKTPAAQAPTLPDSLRNLSGTVVTQVYVVPAGDTPEAGSRPVAARVLEGTGTGLDQVALHLVATGDYTASWVRRRAGRVEGTRVPAWVRVRQTFGG